jgi:lipocalin
LSSLFCVRAAYAWEDAAKRRVAVLNTANEGAVDGPRTNERKTKLRAVVPDETVPSKLAVGPRFVPSAFYGPYWVLAVKPSDAPLGEDDPEKPRGYDWAVVSGGQPNVPGGNDTCRTSLTGVNGSGLWIFTRDPTPSYEVVEEAREAATNLGIDLSEMRAVTHEGCEYPEA